MQNFTEFKLKEVDGEIIPTIIDWHSLPLPASILMNMQSR
jgi:hypothetical protein